MKRTATCLSILTMLVLWASGAYAEDISVEKSNYETKPKVLSIGIVAGYTALSSIVYQAFWHRYEDGRKRIVSDDKSDLDAGPLGGLTFSYLPYNDFLVIGFTLEGFYHHYEGRFKGGLEKSDPGPDNYHYKTNFNFYQINFLGTIYFTDKPFQPYVQLGMGAVLCDSKIGNAYQAAYGASAVVAWGAQYRFYDWFAFGAQARIQDMFGIVHTLEPEKNVRVTIEAQYLPLSFLASANFYF